MSNAAVMSGAAGRYAAALFELASDQGAADAVAADFQALSRMLDDSPELSAMISTPTYGRDDQTRAILAVADAAEFNALTRNTLGLMGRNGRLGATAQTIAAFMALRAAARGEEEVEVISARPLSDAQRDNLADTLKAQLGKDVAISASVDESLLGGLIVRVGSKMIDASLKSKLATLQTAMLNA